MPTTVRPTQPALPFVRRLRRGQFLRFARPRQLCLRAEHGSLWITVDGQREDIQLDPGHSRVFHNTRTLIVSALDHDAVLCATSLAPAAIPWRRRLAAWLGRPVAVRGT